MSVSLSPEFKENPVSPSLSPSPPLLALQESEIKVSQEVYPQLKIAFGVHVVRELTPLEISNRTNVLKLERSLEPNPALDLTSLGILAHETFLYFPAIRFSGEELCKYLSERLHKSRITKYPPFCSGGAVRHCLAGYSYEDLDINIYLEKDAFSLVKMIVRDFLIDKLKTSGAKLDFNNSGVFDLIEAIYLYKKFLCFSKEKSDSFKPHVEASLISLGGIDIKFIYDRKYRYHVASFHRFLLPVNGNMLCYVNLNPTYDDKEWVHSYDELINRKFVVRDYKLVSELIFRIEHAITLGCEIHGRQELIDFAFQQVKGEREYEDLLQIRMQRHLQSHYSHDPQGQLTAILNMLRLCQPKKRDSERFFSHFFNDSDRNNYYSMIATAYLAESTVKDVKWPIGKTLEDFKNVIKKEPMPEIPVLKIRFPNKYFAHFAQFIQEYPTSGDALLKVIHGFVAYDWMQFHPYFSLFGCPNKFPIKGRKAVYYLSIQDQSLKEILVTCLDNWKKLDEVSKIIDDPERLKNGIHECLKVLGIINISFDAAGKQKIINGLMHALEKFHSQIIVCYNPDIIPHAACEHVLKEISTYLLEGEIEEWRIKGELREFRDRRLIKKSDEISQILGLVLAYINAANFRPKIEHLRQISTKMKVLENPARALQICEHKPVRNALARTFSLTILRNIKEPCVEEPCVEMLIELHRLWVVAGSTGIFSPQECQENFNLIFEAYEKFPSIENLDQLVELIRLWLATNEKHQLTVEMKNKLLAEVQSRLKHMMSLVKAKVEQMVDQNEEEQIYHSLLTLIHSPNFSEMRDLTFESSYKYIQYALRHKRQSVIGLAGQISLELFSKVSIPQSFIISLNQLSAISLNLSFKNSLHELTSIGLVVLLINQKNIDLARKESIIFRTITLILLMPPSEKMQADLHCCIHYLLSFKNMRKYYSSLVESFEKIIQHNLKDNHSNIVVEFIQAVGLFNYDMSIDFLNFLRGCLSDTEQKQILENLSKLKKAANEIADIPSQMDTKEAAESIVEPIINEPNIEQLIHTVQMQFKEGNWNKQTLEMCLKICQDILSSSELVKKYQPEVAEFILKILNEQDLTFNLNLETKRNLTRLVVNLKLVHLYRNMWLGLHKLCPSDTHISKYLLQMASELDDKTILPFVIKNLIESKILQSKDFSQKSRVRSYTHLTQYLSNLAIKEEERNILCLIAGVIKKISQELIPICSIHPKGKKQILIIRHCVPILIKNGESNDFIHAFRFFYEAQANLTKKGMIEAACFIVEEIFRIHSLIRLSGMEGMIEEFSNHLMKSKIIPKATKNIVELLGMLSPDKRVQILSKIKWDKDYQTLTKKFQPKARTLLEKLGSIFSSLELGFFRFASIKVAAKIGLLQNAKKIDTFQIRKLAFGLMTGVSATGLAAYYKKFYTSDFSEAFHPEVVHEMSSLIAGVFLAETINSNLPNLLPTNFPQHKIDRVAESMGILLNGLINICLALREGKRLRVHDELMVALMAIGINTMINCLPFSDTNQ
jgi:hypothetical protein